MLSSVVAGRICRPAVGGRLWQSLRFAHVDVKVPTMGESITEGTIQTLKKRIGDIVKADEVIAIIETDKISVDVNSPSEGRLVKVNVSEGDTVYVGDRIVEIETDSPLTPAGGDDTNTDEPSPAILSFAPEEGQESMSSITGTTMTGAAESPQAVAESSLAWRDRKERRVPLSRMRLRIAERLKEAQSEGVLLTTFQECDMSEVSKLRKEIGKQFLEQYGVKLGFNSFFIMASARALQKWPGINSAVEGKNLVERDFIDISVAVATPTGLMVPVIRDADKKGLVTLEEELASLAKRARDGQLSLEAMTGGTFTISNGGIYGSMMGTPIINPPQSAILGMHTIKDRAVVRNGQVVVRPIMYLALTYDHRIVDGREAVSFLKDVSDMIENPASLLMHK